MIVINVENNIKSFLTLGNDIAQKKIVGVSEKFKLILKELNEELKVAFSLYKENVDISSFLIKEKLKEEIIPEGKEVVIRVKDDLEKLFEIYKEVLKVGTKVLEEDLKEKYKEDIIPRLKLSLEKSERFIEDLEKIKYSEVFKICPENNLKFLKVGLACLALSLTSVSIHNYKINEINLPLEVKVSFGLENLENSPIVKTNKKIQEGFDKVVENVTKSVFKSKKEAFISLLGVTEGKSPIFYKDNLGIATAYGWNPTKNKKEFNVEIAKDIGMTASQVKTIEKISENNRVQSVPSNLKDVVLTDKQVKKSAEVMMVYYEKEFLNVLNRKCKQLNKDCELYEAKYHELPANQQAVMIHMAYKVGTPNLLKYNQFFIGLFKYMDNPSEKNLQIIKDNLEYSFKTRKGEVKHDKPVEVLHKFVYEECGFKPSMNILNKNSIIENCKNYLAENYKEIDPKTKKLKVGVKG
jgi:GH24 family phage-related lysozyme (muramidase)